MERLEQVDLLAFGAHPDDVEIGTGGLLAKAVSRGYKVGVVDLTEGEMASTGTVEVRREEAKRAAEILGVAWRYNLKMPDSALEVTRDNQLKVIEVIRYSRPRLVVAPYWEDVHPDHIACSRLVMQSVYLAGLRKLLPEIPAYRPPKIIFYSLHYNVEPSFIVDISEYFSRKKEAVMAHASQFGRQGVVDTKWLLHVLESRNRYFGSRIGVYYGEGYLVKGPLAIDDPITLP
ncbi:bacillithiol biosynthesis deacetylase BshB1 [Calderihabitans maritimus]|uniref:LmbE family protein n=1 Tax=Calderihabitans maritimus TaxID=1246530 RepID=A0A1Z5HUI3_9FIRM|nr:bacillithiol biosynthesis deacetylase BshB1 [Calderihabitans maritimus]GAW93007.1 LmbE family protein [Calderihabitans maritimus]